MFPKILEFLDVVVIAAVYQLWIEYISNLYLLQNHTCAV